MIDDTTVLAEIRLDWAGVEALRSTLQRSSFASVGIDGVFPFSLANAAHNLPFIHAFAVMNDVLEQLADEGKYTCKGFHLRPLLEASKSKLPWRDYDQISDGVKRRNDVAHRGQLLERTECWRYIDLIKNELVSWGII